MAVSLSRIVCLLVRLQQTEEGIAVVSLVMIIVLVRLRRPTVFLPAPSICLVLVLGAHIPTAMFRHSLQLFHQV